MNSEINEELAKLATNINNLTNAFYKDTGLHVDIKKEGGKFYVSAHSHSIGGE